MVCKIADNIFSPLGATTAENLRAVTEGRTALHTYEGRWGAKQPFCAALFEETCPETCGGEAFTRFERLVLASAKRALADVPFSAKTARTVFILSTTKANVEDLTPDALPRTAGESAERVARQLGITTMPVVVSNACISGVEAILLGARLIRTGFYDHAVVCGAECQSRFIVDGFLSLQALSAAPCRPFDMERNGLNVGEAAATIVLSRSSEDTDEANSLWHIADGAVCNDAEQLVAPSKTAEGAYRALRAACGESTQNLAFVNAHGTATLFNDQMEAAALARAGLLSVPVNALKGHFGHTMGAAGVLETVLSMAAANEGIVLGTLGFSERGVRESLLISPEVRPMHGNAFLKMMSGFGGGNAVFRWERGAAKDNTMMAPMLDVKHVVHLTPSGVSLDRQRLDTTAVGDALLLQLYKTRIADYPRFYKMDALSRLGFVASELLLQAVDCERFVAREDCAVILFNRHASTAADRRFLASLSDDADAAPAPSAFVRTLPNIVCGEIALRNKWHGETNFVVLPERSEQQMLQVVSATFADNALAEAVTGWIEYEDSQHFEATLQWVTRRM